MWILNVWRWQHSGVYSHVVLLKKTYVSEACTACITRVISNLLFSLTMEAVCTSEMSVYFNKIIYYYIPEGCHLHIRWVRNWNLISKCPPPNLINITVHIISVLFVSLHTPELLKLSSYSNLTQTQFMSPELSYNIEMASLSHTLLRLQELLILKLNAYLWPSYNANFNCRIIHYSVITDFSHQHKSQNVHTPGRNTNNKVNAGLPSPIQALFHF
jgi:hypothetical protein